MKSMSAKELKNSTGEVIRTLRQGESLLLTFRGKPLGTIEPFRPEAHGTPPIQSFEEAWAGIEAELRRSTPHFPSWRVAEDEARGRR